MTNPKNDGVKRFKIINRGMSDGVEHTELWIHNDAVFPDVKETEVVLASEHDQKVAELQAKLGDHLLTKFLFEKLKLEFTIASKVIHTLRKQRDYWIDHGGWDPHFCIIRKKEMDDEIKIEIKKLKSMEIEDVVEKRL